MTPEEQALADAAAAKAASDAAASERVERNVYEEERRKREAAEHEIAILRENQLRMMATPPPQQGYGSVPVPEPEDEDLQYLDPQTRRAVEKLIEKRGKSFVTQADESARKVYLRESKKQEAVSLYPDLKNPSTEFFKRVAFFMDTHPDKYHDPEGILDGCARVAYEMKYQAAPATQGTNENVRRQVAGGAATIEGSGNAPSNEVFELDTKGQFLASKLGLDPKIMAKRLQNYSKGEGEYAPREGKTGKAAI